ncbi:serine/threonine protein kinase [Neobacillus sp. D3-1R]|uniref:serine/threonine protein kinase n=1 Tax=Neobacillus sp. D3-1R TaxID=3445778 RepID=UPI003F9F7EEC
MIDKVLDLFERPLKNGYLLYERYQISHFIGKGSYGLAYQAMDEKTGKTVVVKQLRKRKNRSQKRLLEREAKILNSLNHPAIPELLNLFEEANRYYLIMEYMEGKNVEEIIFYERVKYDEKESFETLLEVLRVIRSLHENGIVHRDLRLPNILIQDKKVSVIDLGLAVWIHEKEPIPLEALPLEKRMYREISFKSDFYALGHFVLFLLYSNYQVHSSKKNSWEEELSIHENSKHIIRRMLKLDSSYENVDEIITDVEKHLKLI